MAAVPELMPVLSRGKHKRPSRGACFMEYTALLAGEPFTDAPACVDRELAAVLRRANDVLADADRPRLLPLLGRAVGLVVRPPAAHDWASLPLAEAGAYERDVIGHARLTVVLHRRVMSRFLAAVGYVLDHPETLRYDDGREVAALFWDLMDHPGRVRKAEWVTRLIDRLVLLHECYEQALTELGERPAPRSGAPAPRSPADDRALLHPIPGLGQ
jgi:hypothetical protein